MKLSDYGFIMIDPSIEMACKSAKELVADGVQLIELCGAFKGDMPEQVIKAIDGKVPVGHMSYSEEEREKLMAFLKK